MDKNTLSNYGWIVIAVLVLSVMIALATPFGNFVKDAITNTANGLIDTNNNALDVALGASGVCKHQNIVQIKDDTICSDCGNTTFGAETHNGIIPVGGEYLFADGTTLTAGEIFPETVAESDQYFYGDYQYKYFGSYSGWRCKVNDTSKESYAPIPEFVNDVAVTCMNGAFEKCGNLTTAPTMPSTTISMLQTFKDCNGLKTYVGSTDPDGDFSGYVIPSGVTNLNGAFEDCWPMTVPPTIPSNVDNMNYAFFGNYNLTTAPVIPDSVTKMDSTFRNCTALTEAPDVPSNVTTMKYTFAGCTSFKGTITINANPSTYSKCFDGIDMSQITLAGTCDATLKQKIANTGTNGSQVTIVN